MKTIRTQKATDATERQQFISLPRISISGVVGRGTTCISAAPKKKRKHSNFISRRHSSLYLQISLASGCGREGRERKAKKEREEKKRKYKPDLNQTS